MAHFGPYELLDRLGAGGMGEIFLAVLRREGAFEKYLVIKRILPAHSADPQFLEMFNREARIAALLNHQNIVQVYDFGREGDEFYIAMELVDGIDLRTLLAMGGTPPLAATVHMLISVLRGLDYAHRRTDRKGRKLDLVHRDISPGNVLLSREGEVKVTDFGLVTSAPLVQTSESGAVKGKYAYMSPEQSYGDPVDARSDLFSFGVMAYETVTGDRPFRGNALASMAAIRAGEFDAFDAELDTSLAKILTDCLAVHRDDRPESAGAVLSVLEPLARESAFFDGPALLASWVRRFGPQRSQNSSRELTGVASSRLSADEFRTIIATKTRPAAGWADDGDGQQKTTPAVALSAIESLPGSTAAAEPVSAEHRAVDHSPDHTDDPAARVERAADSRRRAKPSGRKSIWLVATLLVGAGLTVTWWSQSNPSLVDGSGSAADSDSGRDVASDTPVAASETGIVRFETEPAGATVYVDGQERGVTPISIELQRDSAHEVIAELPNYQPERLLVRVDDVAPDPEGHPLVNLRLLPQPALLHVSSTPEPAQVRLDDRLVGETPLDLELAEMRAYRLEVSSPTFESDTTSVLARPNAQLSFDAVLVPVVALWIEGVPEQASIQVQHANGSEERCAAPCRVTRRGGPAQVFISAPQHASWSTTTDFGSPVLTFELTPHERRLQASWSSADLRLSGGSRRTLSLGEEQHRISLSDADAGFSGTLSVDYELSGDRVDVTVDLRTTPWSDFEFDGERTTTPAQLESHRLRGGRHPLLIRVVAEDGVTRDYQVTLFLTEVVGP